MSCLLIVLLLLFQRMIILYFFYYVLNFFYFLKSSCLQVLTIVLNILSKANASFAEFPAREKMETIQISLINFERFLHLYSTGYNYIHTSRTTILVHKNVKTITAILYCNLRDEYARINSPTKLISYISWVIPVFLQLRISSWMGEFFFFHLVWLREKCNPKRPQSHQSHSLNPN